MEESNILVAFLTYFVGIISPGPTTIAIMSIAMDKGRNPALMFVLGVLIGTLIWAFMALFGVAVLFSTYPSSLSILKIIGGFYLILLSYKSIKKIYNNKTSIINNNIASSRLFFQGFFLHITNPKAIFTWLAIVALAMPHTSSVKVSLIVVMGCLMLSVFVFGGYALLFSTLKAQNTYRKLGHWFDSILAITFGASGCKLLFF